MALQLANLRQRRGQAQTVFNHLQAPLGDYEHDEGHIVVGYEGCLSLAE